jgi:hypothetical protein
VTASRTAIVAVSALLALSACDRGASIREPLPGTLETLYVVPAPVTIAPPTSAPQPPAEEN